jgi:hypothetical protein
MKRRGEFMFSADFRCGCSSIIGVLTFAAVVDGVGLEVYCRQCRQGYTVTRKGAIPITKGERPER